MNGALVAVLQALPLHSRSTDGRPDAGGLSFFSRFAPFQARLDETTKQRMRLRRLGAELRMALHGHEPRVLRQLDRLHQLSVRRRAGEGHAVRGELLAILIV